MTPERIAEIRADFFGYATSTVTDRERAEHAVSTIMTPVLGGYALHWADTPSEGARIYASLYASLRDSLRLERLEALELIDARRLDIWYALRESFRDSFGAELGAEFGAGLRDELYCALQASLWNLLRDSLGVPLRDALHDVLRDSGLIAYQCAMVECACLVTPDAICMLAYRDLFASAFALWVLPEHVILCPKPTSVEVVDGRLMSASWDRRP